MLKRVDFFNLLVEVLGFFSCILKSKKILQFKV